MTRIGCSALDTDIDTFPLETILMTTSDRAFSPPEVHTERLDDIPVVLEILIQMDVPGQVDRVLLPHGNWQGLSVGWVVTLWLAYILTQQDHRMNHVQAWVRSRQEALSQLSDQPLRETDFTDDRLAEVLGYLSQDAVWHAVEAGLSQHSIRVYHLSIDTVRLDATVGQTYHDPQQHTLFKAGRTKTGDYDTQFKLMLGALDPMGLPLAVDVVAGNQSDDPLYVPVYQRIHQTLEQGGLLYVGDAKMGALETRATIQAGDDLYLMPLAMVGDTPALLDQQLDRLEAGACTGTPIFLPEDLPEDPTQTPDPSLAVAQGFETAIERTAVVDARPLTWTERLLCIQSFSYVEAQVQAFDRRLQRAQNALEGLTPPVGRGRKQYPEAAPLQGTVEAILRKYKVSDFLTVTLERQETHHSIRAYGDRPARTEVKVRYQIHITPNPEAIERARRRLGWRLYASNASVRRLSLSQAVLTYRDQYLVERDFARLQGRPLGITPLYVQRDDHALGLMRLLTVALRALVMVEFIARRHLEVEDASLSGLYAGNPKRKTHRPTAEQLLAAFGGITYTTIPLPDGSRTRHVTPLTPVQETILALLEISPTLYTQLAFPSQAFVGSIPAIECAA